jgi:hypothetical protein
MASAAQASTARNDGFPGRVPRHQGTISPTRLKHRKKFEPAVAWDFRKTSTIAAVLAN